MNDKIDIEKIKKTGEFKVPEGYFDQLTESIESKIDSGDNGAQIVSIQTKVRNTLIFIGMAACLAVGFFVLRNSEKADCETFACLLENTVITNEDLETLEAEDSGSFFEEEDNEEYLF